MTEFLIHLWHYLVRVGDYAFTLGGTSRIGFFGLVVAPPIYSAFMEIKRSLAEGKTVKQAVGKLGPSSIFKRPTVIVWSCVVIWSFCAVTYQDHIGLVRAKQTVATEKNGLSIKDQATINDLKGQLNRALHPPDTGPPFTWDTTKNALFNTPDKKPGVQLFITAKKPIEDLAFEIKCSVPCKFFPGQSMSYEPMEGLFPDAPEYLSPTVVRLRFRVPNHLNRGGELGLYFVSSDSQEVKISWVHLLPN